MTGERASNQVHILGSTRAAQDLIARAGRLALEPEDCNGPRDRVAYLVQIRTIPQPAFVPPHSSGTEEARV